HVQCHKDTRKEVLAMLRSWLRPDHPPLSDRAILWLHALAGSGKSTIALTISERWERDKLLGASFFCSRDGEQSDINSIFRTIAYQLALHFPAFREQLTKILETDPDLFSSNPTRQLEKLIVAPLQAVQSDGKSETLFPAQVAVVVDALDECTDTAAVSTVLKSLALYIDQLAPLKFLITSRPEENITRGFLLRCLERNTQTLALDKIPGDLTRRDISAFLQSRLDEIRDNFALNTSWPIHQQLENLVDLSELLFIFAAAAVRYIGDQAERDPENRLTSLLDAGNAAAAKRGTSTSPFTILDALYTQVLETAVRKLGPVLKARLKVVLGTIVLAEQRLSPTTLESLLELPSGTVRRVLPVLSSILTIPDREDDTTPIRIIHLSFPNFLINHTRCTDQSFLVEPRIQHSHIAFRCLDLMQALKYNILEVASEHDCALNSEFPDLLVKISQHLPAALQYACKYWTHHLCEAEIGEDLVAALEGFCGSHLLHWLEVLSLLGCVDGVVMALQSSLRATDVQSLLYDCERAVRAFYPIISTSAIHIYSTVALFAPLNSPIRQFAAADARTSLVVRVGLENTWSDTLLSRVIGRCFVEDCAFSPDGMCVAFTKRNGTIQLLNACTGAELQIFKSHASKSLIRSCSFSPAGKEVLSGSDDGSVNLWDVATGANLNTWKAHSDWVFSVAWSPDGTLAASASDDKTVRLWRVAFPEDMVLLHHGGWVFHVVFAPDGDLLSGSSDGMCKVWDTRRIGWGMEPTQTLKHHSEVLTVAVSSDSSLVACGLDNGEIVLWTKSDGRQLRSLPGGSADRELLGNRWTVLQADATSPRRKLILAVSDGELRIYDVSTGRCMRTIDHPSDTSPYASWSPTGKLFACTGRDHAVHVWKTGTGELVGSFTGHPWYVTGVFFTPDEQYILSASWDGMGYEREREVGGLDIDPNPSSGKAPGVTNCHIWK
ncbi:WD40 repeat-like protein, partial [Cubamyces sp. BRFM 1775]